MLVLSVSFLSLVFISQINAQSVSNGFSISPPSFDLNANKGDVVTNTIKIENPTEQLIHIRVRSENFVAYGDGGQINLTEEDSTYSINKWLTFPIDDFNVLPGETYLFDYTLNIPEDAEPGSHYGAIVFSSVPSSDPNASTVVQEIGSIILIRIPGEVVEEATLITFSSEKNFYSEPKIKLNALIENVGSVHFKPYGFITIKDILGNKIETIEVQPRNILPGSRRLFDQEFDFNNIGIYRAELQLFYKGGGKTITAETTFTALNTQKLLPIVGVLLGIIVFYLIFRKRINRAVKVIIKG